MARIENGVILASMALDRSDVLDAAVAAIVVVPVHELRRPGSDLIEAGKALDLELGPVQNPYPGYTRSTRAGNAFTMRADSTLTRTIRLTRSTM